MTGATCLHGPHHAAQKSTSTGTSEFKTSSSNVSVVTAIGSDMLYLPVVFICSLVYFGVKGSGIPQGGCEAGERGGQEHHPFALFICCFPLQTSTVSVPPRKRFVKIPC